MLPVLVESKAVRSRLACFHVVFFPVLFCEESETLQALMDLTSGSTNLMLLRLSECVVQLSRAPTSLLSVIPALSYVNAMENGPPRDNQSVCRRPVPYIGEVVQPNHFGVWAPTDRNGNRSVLEFLFRSGSEQRPPTDRNG